MPRFTFITFSLILALLFAFSAPTSLAARLLPTNTMPSPNTLFLTALPKGTIPTSSPSKKVHSMLLHHNLTARHLVQSVPSPGVGH
uniref:Uncharacterized protein n=1 Tax=Cucumis sativus TaxID=3659 RepID=A0A0A0KKF2_CUCSA